MPPRKVNPPKEKKKVPRKTAVIKAKTPKKPPPSPSLDPKAILEHAEAGLSLLVGGNAVMIGDTSYRQIPSECHRRAQEAFVQILHLVKEE